MKHKRIAITLALVGLLISITLAWFFLNNYYTTVLNPSTSAAPIAQELKPYIDDNELLVLHTYNRHLGGFLNTNTVPSYEYYIENPTSDIDKYAKSLTAFLTKLGYNVQRNKYIYDERCSLDTPGVIDLDKQYCEKTVGTNDTQLLGTIVNENEPYWVIFGEKNKDSVEVQISHKEFSITSNDFWRKEYADKTGIVGSNENKVRSGKSVTTAVFSK